MDSCIMACVSTTSMSILVNDCPTKPLRMQRGIRQQDPLSPYFFIRVNEALIFLIKETRRKELIHGVEVYIHDVIVSQLQFANDTLIFLLKNEESLINYRRMLDCYIMLFVLQIHFSK